MIQNKRSWHHFHGISSLVLIYAAFILGVVAVLQATIVLGLINVFLAAAWIFPVAWCFCRKCTCRLNCGHGLPGLVTRIMPEKEPGSYTKWDLLATFVPLILAVGFPQYWLWQNTGLFVVYWILVVLAGTEALVFVCAKCANENCPIKQKQNKV